jgi:hypothetical protein
VSRFTPVEPSPLGPVNCNCACQRCLDGDCCMVPRQSPELPTYTFTTTSTPVMVIRCGPIDHDFNAAPTGGLYCRKCGERRP